MKIVINTRRIFSEKTHQTAKFLFDWFIAFLKRIVFSVTVVPILMGGAIAVAVFGSLLIALFVVPIWIFIGKKAELPSMYPNKWSEDR